ncbi:MAG: adenine deaminase [Acidobacteriota bacterium]|nr:MAG: adenine deaminase [Acidobacteriota bacterium]
MSESSRKVVLRGGKIVDVQHKSVREGDVVVENDVIVAVGGRAEEDGARTLDVTGRYVAPGLIDAHLHIESSMLTPLEFARNAVRHGTTAVFVDPHEIANVAGRTGIKMFLEQAKQAPIDIFVGVPSCVPATPLEQAGATIGVEDIRALIGHEGVYGLAEMMNFPGIIHGKGDAREKVELVFELGKIVDGHSPRVSGEDLRRYVSNGRDDGVVRIMGDHESSEAEEALEKRRLGMYVAMRYSTLSADLDRILPGVLQQTRDLDGFMLCSDDIAPIELAEQGHMDRTVRRARELLREHAGLELVEATLEAIALATVQPGRYFERFFAFHDRPGIGTLAPGRRANIVVFDSLERLDVDKVLRGGQLVVDAGEYLGEDVAWNYGGLLETVRIARLIRPDDFSLHVGTRGPTATVRVIGIVPKQLPTALETHELPLQNGRLHADPERDIAKIAVIERHHGTGAIGVGLVRGLGLERGAVASTVAHDSHNLVVAGVDDESMARVANRLVELGGGLAAVGGDAGDASGEAAGELALPVGGLMSAKPIAEVVAHYRKLQQMVRQTGSPHENLFMILSFLPLAVIPELRITSNGLVDVGRFELVPLEVS